MVLVLLSAACGGSEPPAVPAASGEEAAAGREAAGLAGAAVLLSPGDEVSVKEGFTFRWSAPEGAGNVLWRVVVLEGPQRAIWRSTEGPSTEVEAPAALLLRLGPDRAYTWRVLGRVPGQGRLEPAEGTFTVR